MFTNLSSPSIHAKEWARNLSFAVLQIHIMRLCIDPGVCNLQHTTVDWYDTSGEFGPLEEISCIFYAVNIILKIRGAESYKVIHFDDNRTL